MIRTEFITSPSEAPRQLDPRPDVDSDDLWLAKFKSKGAGKKKGKGKTTLSPSFIPSSEMVLNADSRTDSPLSRFQSSVTQMTGYSPLNPTSSLHDELHISGLVTDSDYPGAKSPVAFSRQPLAPTPLSRVPSEGTVSDSPSTSSTSYEAIRPQLFQQAFIQSINGAKFDDTDIYVYSARSRSGKVHKPKLVRARRAFLNAACANFERDIGPSARVQAPVESTRAANRTAYGYDIDSDLEECEDEPSAISKGTFVSGSPPKQSSTVQSGTPKSSVLNLSDGDMVSLDGFGSETGLSEILNDTALEGPSKTQSRISPKPSLSLETATAVLSWRNENEHKDATPRDALTDLPRRTSLIVEDEPPTALLAQTDEVVLFIPDSAHRTWQALLLYLYNDYIQFAPLRSEGQASRLLTVAGPTCSPKSMYRLANKLGLENLKQKACVAIEQALSKENIVKELFSDFTWRYPEILAMETNVFYRYSSEAVVQKAMSDAFQDIARGQLPQSSIVLSSLFNRFVVAKPTS